MDRNKLNEIITALNRKNVSQPCPRCAAKNFSVVGESEISVTQPPSQAGGMVSLASLGRNIPTKTTMPIIIVTCDNCGYISQHAVAALGLTPSLSSLASLARFAK